MNKIIVIGGNHHNTLGVIRSLGYKGLKSSLVLVGKYENPFVKYSRYIDDFVEVDNEDDAITTLVDNKHKNKNAVVIACSDGMSSALDIHRNELIDTYRIPCSTIQGKITEIMNKEVMSQLARNIGFNVPSSWIFENEEDLYKVDFPCITKPILSISGLKSDIVICSNVNELRDVVNGGSCKRFQVQKFVDKDFEYQLIGLSINGGEELIIPGFSRCIRPCLGTNTGFLHYESLNDNYAPLDLCKKFVRATGYSGLFSIEFLRDKKGVDYFMEMNFRNDGNAICVTASGTNLPYIWYLANSGGDYKSELASSSFKSIFVMPEFADYKNFVRNHKITLRNWIVDMSRTSKFMVFDRTDMRPFIAEIGNIINRAFRRVWLKS